MLEHILIFLGGMMVGAIVGVIVMACLYVARRADEQAKQAMKAIEGKEPEPQGVEVTPEEYLKSQSKENIHTAMSPLGAMLLAQMNAIQKIADKAKREVK